MHTISLYWLPILASAAAVWVASAVIWMALPHHKKDVSKLPDEDGFRGFVKSASIPPGSYMFPFCDSHSAAGKAEMKAKWESGPTGILRVWGKVNMGRNMALTFLVFLAVSYLIAYLLGSSGVEPSATFAMKFKLAGTAGILAYCFSFIPNGIWFGQSGRAIAMTIVDGVIYGLVTGAVFAALWPGH